MLSVGNRFIKKQDMKSNDLSATEVIQQQKTPMMAFIQKHLNDGEPYSYRVFPLLNNPFNNNVPAYFYPSIGGYSATKLSSYQDLIDHSLMKEGSINMPVLDMLNVKYVTYNRPLSLPGMKKVYSKNDHVVMENTNVLPKAFFVDSVVMASTPQQAIDQVNSASFKPGQWAVVESDHKPATQPDSSAQVKVNSYEANEITITTNRKSSGFMVLSEIYYPAGWKATIDGKPADIYKTDFVLRGIEVPGGNHHIKFTFKPASAHTGSILSWLGHGLLGCLFIAAVFFIYRRERQV
jgi:uncharacterized membrane protein YfhO